jgi:hypothetical protein
MWAPPGWESSWGSGSDSFQWGTIIWHMSYSKRIIALSIGFEIKKRLPLWVTAYESVFCGLLCLHSAVHWLQPIKVNYITSNLCKNHAHANEWVEYRLKIPTVSRRKFERCVVLHRSIKFNIGDRRLVDSDVKESPGPLSISCTIAVGNNIGRQVSIPFNINSNPVTATRRTPDYFTNSTNV